MKFKVEGLEVNLVELGVKALLWLYNWLVYILTGLLESTVFKGREELAQEYASATTILVSITAIYLILTLFEGIKKFLKILLVVGWILLGLAVALGVVGGV